MTREQKEAKKKAGQALLIAEFPEVCRAAITILVYGHHSTEYDPTTYWRLVELSGASIISNLHSWENPPKIRKEWKLGMERELKQAWDGELVKKKEDVFKRVREQIPKVCEIKITCRCKDVQYPILTEYTFNRILHFSGGREPHFKDSWKEDLRGDVTKAWDAEVEKAKADGRLPKTLEDAFKIAWACMERTKPFAHHDWINMEGLRCALTNLITGYPDSLWLSWPSGGWNRPHVFVLNYIPKGILENLQALYKEINARGANPA